VADNLEHLRPWMPWAAYAGRAASLRFLTGSEAGWRRGERFEYAIRPAEGRAIMGSAGLIDRVGPGGLEIGYWLGWRWTGRGHATVAAAALCEAALALDRVEHVEIHHDEANTASAGVPARLGFHLLGTFPAPRLAPAEAGREVRWRLEQREFAGGAAAQLLAGVRG
jgi:RimJ/RimL family protein N-acetyltransferase